MKLVIKSIICGFLALVVSSLILVLGIDALHGMVNEEDGDIIIALGVFVSTLTGFFSPGLYVLNKLYEKSKKEKEKENTHYLG